MNKIFKVQIYNKDREAELWLPATPYQLLDIVDKLQIIEEVRPSIYISQYDEHFKNLNVVMEDELDLFELNALAKRLSQFALEDMVAFHALVSIELEHTDGDELMVRELLNLAYSTDCCDVHLGIDTYEELGRFYVENDMIPELKNLPEETLAFLNYEGIGKKLCKEEGGMLVPGGHVTQTSELKKLSDTMEFGIQKPEYTMLLKLSYDQKDTVLMLPAESSMLESALEKVGAPDFDKVQIQCLDCAASSLIPHIGDGDNIAHINRLAQQLCTLDEKSLTKLNAVLEATEDYSALGATHIAYNLDDYLFSPQYATPDDMARDYLSSSLGEPAMETLLKYLNLYGYGEALMKEQECAMTEYGLVSREDGQCLKTSLTPSAQPEMSGMTMK